jgi:chromosome segregation ATPase
VTADADRIAQLEEQLGEMRAARDRFDRLSRSHDAAHERTKAELAEAWRVAEIWRNDAVRERDAAQADLARARADLADTRAQLAKVRHDRDEMIRVHDEVEKDRDRVQGEARRLSGELLDVEAQAAAMREAIEWLRDHHNSGAQCFDLHEDEHHRIMGIVDRALAGAAGRALADRVDLWRDLEKAADECKGTGGTNPEDGPFSRLRGVLAKLAALDPKGGDA